MIQYSSSFSRGGLKIALSSLLALMLCVPSIHAQYKDQGSGGGLGFGIQMGGLRKDDRKGKLQARAYLRHPLAGPLLGEFGAGTGEIAGTRYRTQIHTADYRLLLNPFSLRGWNIYLYGGAGALYYELKQVSPNTPASMKRKGWAASFPGGLGLQIALNPMTSLDFSGGVTYSFTDNLNATINKKNDLVIGSLMSITVHGESEDSDPDDDRLSTKVERQLGSDPKDPDSDGDGLADGDEYFKHKTDLRAKDSDGDGIDDGHELQQYRTNPNNTDSDGDAIEDNVELVKHNTDPSRWDTDGDGLNDGDEILRRLTDPLKVDTDGDELSDEEEVIKSRTDPLKLDTDFDGLPDGNEMNKFFTSPNAADSDNDGLSDSDEVLKYKTNAIQRDSDFDGLLDGEELTKYGTDPLDLDTDSGGVGDGDEVQAGTNPLRAKDDVPEEKAPEPEPPAEEPAILDTAVGKPIVLEGISFPTGSANISRSSTETLMQVYNTLIEYPNIEIEIHGYTDSTGTRQTNMRLSQARADAVRAFLIKKGIEPARITAKGFGPDNPVESNATPEGRQANRRIEFIRVK